MNKPLRFNVKFKKESTHEVLIVVFDTLAHMKAVMKKSGDRYPGRHTVGLFWQTKNPVAAGIIGTIFLAREDLTLNTIIHECAHAAYFRTMLMGFQQTGVDFQESVAISVGDLSEALIGFLSINKVPIRYEIQGVGTTKIRSAFKPRVKV